MASFFIYMTNCANMKLMIKLNQRGAVSGTAISLAITVVLLVIAIAFGGWAYTSRQDYKNDSDKKAAAAADQAKQAESKRKDVLFAQELKNPLKTYNGPEAYGGLHLEFPKTWSGYVDDTGKGQALVDGFFAPGVVPSATDQNSVFAVRVQVLNQPYAQVLQNFDSQIKAGKLSVSAYALPKLPNTVGVMANGQLSNQKTVTMAVLPLRSQTVQIWTEGTQYADDFNKIILANFTFSP